MKCKNLSFFISMVIGFSSVIVLKYSNMQVSSAGEAENACIFSITSPDKLKVGKSKKNTAYLLSTGQTKCYNKIGQVIDRHNSESLGQDGFYQSGYPMKGRFIDNQNGTITDKATGLMWQKTTADINSDGEITWNKYYDKLAWQQALKYCENLVFASHNDWRLPNVRELQSILHFGRGQWSVGPPIDPVFNTKGGYYWSSTSCSDGRIYAYTVNFSDCETRIQRKDSQNYVRVVRTCSAGVSEVNPPASRKS